MEGLPSVDSGAPNGIRSLSVRARDLEAQALAAVAAWRFVDPGGNGWATFVGINAGNGHLYVSSDMKYSLFRSRDRGESWEPIANPVLGTATCVAADPEAPERLFLSQAGEAPESRGIWRSADGGDSWEQVCATGCYGAASHGAGMGQSGLVDPEDGRVLYWTTDGGTVLRSRDGGRSWRELSDGLPLGSIGQLRHLNALISDSEGGSAGRTLYYPTVAGLYRLRGAGRDIDRRDATPAAPSWELLRPGPCTQAALGAGGCLYAAFPREGLFLSRDGGGSWEALTAGLDGKKAYRVQAAAGAPVLYVATMEDRGIYRSADGGASFSLITRNRHDGDRNWPANYRGLEAVSGMTMLLDPRDPDTLYLDYNKKTHDGGRTWLHYGTREVAPDRWSGTGLALLTEYQAEFDPLVPGKVWLGFSDIGLCLTEDGGESLHCVPSYHRGEVNQVAGIRDERVYSSGSCPAIALDPERPTTIWATISGKQGPSRAMQGGLLVKSLDGGWNWDPIGAERGLPDGIVRAIRIDPKSPVGERRLYVASYGNGIYLSADGGASFRPSLDRTALGVNSRVMDLQVAHNDTRILFAAVGGSRGKRPLSVGPASWPGIGPGDPGAVWRSLDGGAGWLRVTAASAAAAEGRTFLPNVQSLAVDPDDDAVVYAACCDDPFLEAVGQGRGGLWRSLDRGASWERLFPAAGAAGSDGAPAPGGHDVAARDVVAVAVNPADPAILHIAVQGAGVYGSLDGGESWYLLGGPSMERRQRRYFSVSHNLHDPAEVWVAHFGSSFSRTDDPAAAARLEAGFRGANLARNGDFSELDAISGWPRHWRLREALPAPEASPAEAAPIASLVRDEERGTCVRFRLTPERAGGPSPRAADREQRRLEADGLVPADAEWAASPENRADTRCALEQRLPPHVARRLRGKAVRIGLSLKVLSRRDRGWWLNWAESCEVERFPPQLVLYEIRERNLGVPVAETSLEASFAEPPDYLGRWVELSARGRVSGRSLGLVLVLTGSAKHTAPLEALATGIFLRLDENPDER